MTTIQPAVAGVPVSGTTPQPYIAPATAITRLTERWGLTATVKIGHVLVASMQADQEGPWQGVKLVVEQDREWPRTFKYGWPNMLATPSPVMVSQQYPGAWYLDYEGVVPEQIVDWVCLQCWRLVNLPFDQWIESESVTGATVKYAPPLGTKGGLAAELDHIQSALLAPFQVRQGHTAPFLNFSNL